MKADQKNNAFAVIPDAEKLDIGSNKVVAIFKYKNQAEKFAVSMWKDFFIIKKVYCDFFETNG